MVIPTLDEEASLPQLLQALGKADEVIVSDGGSRDRTREIARRSGACVVTGPPGRGGQLNRGAAMATSDVLLFLHADTRLPEPALGAVAQAVASGAAGGAFAVEFDARGLVWRLGDRLVSLRTRWTGVPLGDQAQFVTRTTFDRLGGFAEWPILEDLDFARRLKRAGRTVLLRPPVITSARRYQQRGIARTIATNWLIWLLFFLGVPAARLARLYRPQQPPDNSSAPRQGPSGRKIASCSPSELPPRAEGSD